MKFLVPNYSCLQNPWLGGYRPQIRVLSVLCPQLNLLNPHPRTKFLGMPLLVAGTKIVYITVFYIHCSVHHCNCSKIITNKMTLMDNLYFAVSLPSLYMFRASGSSSSGVHFFSVQAVSGILCNLLLYSPVLLRVLFPTVCVSQTHYIHSSMLQTQITTCTIWYVPCMS